MIDSARTRELLAKYATNAPRYTSYPTAVDWSKSFDAMRYPQLLERAASSNEPLSVYAHLPYCAELCLFCGCNVVISRSRERMERYVAHLERELELVRASGIGRRSVRQYHWGGGTPTQLPLALMDRVHAAFERTFTLTSDAEVAVEIDPRVTTAEQIQWLAAHGWNRVSLGLQDFDPAVQKAVKRNQTEAQTLASIDAARAHGIRSINVDLIYGLPLQTRASFAATVEKLVLVRPERIALFQYAHVPWMKKHQTALDVEDAPGSEDKLAIFTHALERFRDAGYVDIGLDHFALPDDELAIARSKGELHRNFMGYTTRHGSDMVSLGVSSIGEVAGAFVQNAPIEADYLKHVDERGFATVRGHELSSDDRLRRDVILALMCNGVLDKRTIETRHAIAFDTTFERELLDLRPLEADGLVTLDGARITVTELGQLFLRNVALPFDRYYRERRAAGGDSSKTFSRTA